MGIGDNGNIIGRPPTPIDWDLFEDMCDLQCTQQEIANVFHCNRETLRLKAQQKYGMEYQAVYDHFATGGKVSLRRSQFKLARKNAGMAIFLGKNYLGQKDNDTTITIAPELTEQFTAIMKQLAEGQRVIQAEPVAHETIEKLRPA
jgi:hypothetical protein